MKGKEVPVLRVVKVSCEVTYRVFIIKKFLKHVLSYPLQRVKKCIYIYSNGLNIWFLHLIHQQRRKKMILKDYLKERKKK